jgi:3-phosphoshikimate 1-carboxyvinyltransferase
MVIDFSKSQPRETVILPPSKSLANRQLIIAALAGEPIRSDFPGQANDTQILKELLLQSGSIYNTGMAGTAFRFLTAYLSLKPGIHVLTGEERMLQRPIGPLVKVLNELGAKITFLEKDGYPPLQIEGGFLIGGKAEIPGDISSQYISALLMVAPLMQKGLELRILKPYYSEPYVDMTMMLMEKNGIEIEEIDEVYKIVPQQYRLSEIAIEPDWSAASYWYEMVALGVIESVILPGLSPYSLQGDSICAMYFEGLGVSSDYIEAGSILRKSGLPWSERARIDFQDCPDLAQTLVCTCAGMGMKGHFSGIKSLRIKETDRVAALVNELAKLGVTCITGDDFIEITEFGEVQSRTIETYNDHRMAMAFAPLAFKFGPLDIKNPEIVAKSYPGYWEDLGVF